LEASRQITLVAGNFNLLLNIYSVNDKGLEQVTALSWTTGVAFRPLKSFFRNDEQKKLRSVVQLHHLKYQATNKPPTVSVIDMPQKNHGATLLFT
jgi:hypothetical protein